MRLNYLFALLLVTAHWNITNAQFSFNTYALHDVNILDVNLKTVVENQTIVIHKDRILEIYDSKTYTNADTVQLLNYSGQ